MKKIIIILTAIFLNNAAFAKSNIPNCNDAAGLWIGKFSYKDTSLCQLKHPELCEKVNIAIGIKYLANENLYLADIYPQRGVAGSLKLLCENGQLKTMPGDSNLPPETKISYNCDEFDNCIVMYEDYRLKSLLIKMWEEDIRI